MARRKKRGPPLTKTNTTTPDSKERGNQRIQFHKKAINRECQRMSEELVSIGEDMMKKNRTAEEYFIHSITQEIGNMTLKEFFDAGYMLDFQHPAPAKGPFVSLSPLHFEIKDTEDPESVPENLSKAEVRRTSQFPTQDMTQFATPATKTIPLKGAMFITPKAVLQPKRGHITVYSENGSPYHLNLTTMRAKLPSIRENKGEETVGRVTRSTRK